MDATKSVLDHIGWQRLEGIQAGVRATDPKILTDLYGSVRRLRDLLQKLLSESARPTVGDLGEEDRNLLSACALHEIGRIELAVQNAQSIPSEELTACEQKVLSLKQSALALATRPIERIPSPEASALATFTVRQLLAKIRSATVRTVARSGDSGQFGIPNKYNSPPPAASQAAAAPAAGPKSSSGTMLMGAGLRPMAQQPVAGSVPGRSATDWIDPQQAKDPRLRALLAIELKAFDRAYHASDHRMAVVHLAALVEAIVIDSALPRARELGLTSAPESWDLGDVFDRVLGKQLKMMDRAFLVQLAAARNMLRPVTQLQNPIVVTANTVSSAIDFVNRIATTIGWETSLSSLPVVQE